VSRLSGLHDGSAAAGRQGGAAAPWAMTGSYPVRVIFHALVQVSGVSRLRTPHGTQIHRILYKVHHGGLLFAGARTPRGAVSGRLEEVWRDKKISSRSTSYLDPMPKRLVHSPRTSSPPTSSDPLYLLEA
jgi:hypothetical protein